MTVSPEHGLIRRPDRLFIGGEWVRPTTDSAFEIVDSGTEQVFLRVAEAQTGDVESAIGAARAAFDRGPWPRLSHGERATMMRSLATELRRRSAPLGEAWTRQSGVLHTEASGAAERAARTFEYYAGLAETYPFEEVITPTSGSGYGVLLREPVGVLGAIVPWNAPMPLMVHKLAPALLAGCTIILKVSPEAPTEGYLVAEAAEAAGLPAGVLNMVTADRAASELLVRDPRVDKIAFTGSTTAGRRIASLAGERIARYTLELGGKSPAIVLDDADLGAVAASISGSACRIAGQVCASLTRIIVSRHRHDELVDALVSTFGTKRVGDPFDPSSQMGPLAMERQRDRVEDFISIGLSEGAVLATGGGRPKDLDRGWYLEPTVFAGVDNTHTIAREEIFGPVLTVIPVDDEAQAVEVANDTIYGLNAAVFTPDSDRAMAVGRQLRSGSVGHNGSRYDLGVAFGGYKQSGVGREGGLEGLLPYLEVKYMVLDQAPTGHRSAPIDGARS